MNFTKQEYKILFDMARGMRMTALDAAKMGIMRLGARVYDLKAKGIIIQDAFVTVNNALGGESVVKHYWLEPSQRELVKQLLVQHIDNKNKNRTKPPCSGPVSVAGKEARSRAADLDENNNSGLLFPELEKPQYNGM